MPINEKEVVDLIFKLKSSKNIEEKEKIESDLLELNYDLIIKSVEKACVDGFDKEDLVQEGFIAFINAINTFDINKDIKFNKYAESIIVNRIKKVIKEEKESLNVSNELVNTLNKIIDVEKELENNFGRVPNEEEVSFELGITIEEYINYKEYAARVLEDECLKNMPTISKMIEHMNEHNKNDNEDNESLIKSLNLLDDREKEVIKRFYGIDYPKMTLEMISNDLMLSIDKVEEIVENATNKIKNNLED